MRVETAERGVWLSHFSRMAGITDLSLFWEALVALLQDVVLHETTFLWYDYFAHDEQPGDPRLRSAPTRSFARVSGEPWASSPHAEVFAGTPRRALAYAPGQEAEGRDYSAFGTATYSFPSLPKLKVSAGLRYDHAERSTLQREGSLDLSFGSVIAYPNADLSADFEVLLPRVAVRYEAGDDLTWYGSMAPGWVPGGFNLAAVQAGFTDPNILLYDKETLWSRELGFHWRRPGLRMSGAVFHITSDHWQDIQVASDANGRPVSCNVRTTGGPGAGEIFGARVRRKPERRAAHERSRGREPGLRYRRKLLRAVGCAAHRGHRDGSKILISGIGR